MWSRVLSEGWRIGGSGGRRCRLCGLGGIGRGRGWGRGWDSGWGLAAVLAGGVVEAGLGGPFLKGDVDEVGGEYGPSGLWREPC